jgi:hypothetical protein
MVKAAGGKWPQPSPRLLRWSSPIPLHAMQVANEKGRSPVLPWKSPDEHTQVVVAEPAQHHCPCPYQ